MYTIKEQIIVQNKYIKTSVGFLFLTKGVCRLLLIDADEVQQCVTYTKFHIYVLLRRHC